MSRKALFCVLGLGFLLLGGCNPFGGIAGPSPAEFRLLPYLVATSLVFATLLCTAYSAKTFTNNHFLQALASFLAFIVAAIAIFFLPARQNHFVRSLKSVTIVAIVFLTIGAIFCGTLLALAPIAPRAPLYTLVTGAILATALVWFVLKQKNKETKPAFDSLIIPLLYVIITVGLSCGSLLTIGLVDSRLFIPSAVILAGAGAITYIIYVASMAKAARAKVGVYAVAFILTYEIFLLFQTLFNSWRG